MSLFNYYCDEVKRIIEEVSPNYPQLTTYESEWLYFYENDYTPGTPVELEYEAVHVNHTGSVSNAIPYQYKSAILKGSTKYRDIDTGDILETFEKGRKLELVSVKNPVDLTTSNEDGTKSNILTVNEDVVLRGVGDMKDELNLLTGELTQHIGKVVLNGSESWNKWFHSGTTYRFFTKLSNVSTEETLILCDKLPSIGYSSATNIYISSGRINVIFDNSTGILPNDTASSFKTWLSANVLTVVYPMVQPTVKTVDLTPLNNPYEGVNHYQLTSNIPCEAILEVPVVSTGNQTIQEINN